MAYVASLEPERIDRNWVWSMLCTEAYWLPWRTRDDVETQLDTAWRLGGVYDAETHSQVGFARALSDGVSDAYLTDMIVDPAHRGRGVGKMLMRSMVDDEVGRRLHWMLVTTDAHTLYAQFGFTKPNDRMMVRPALRAEAPHLPAKTRASA